MGISAGLLIVISRAETVLLSAGRACSMGSFAILCAHLLSANHMAEGGTHGIGALAGHWRWISWR